MKRKSKRRVGHYIRGVFHSQKCLSGPVKYRSSWELVACLYFDDDPNVLSYSYESLIVPYVSNARTNKMRNYYPDFVVEYKDGTKTIIEIKRNKQTTNLLVLKKAKACEAWAKQNGMTYIFWTEKEILPLRKHYVASKPELFPKRKRKKPPQTTKAKTKKLSPIEKKKKMIAIQTPLKLPWA